MTDSRNNNGRAHKFDKTLKSKIQDIHYSQKVLKKRLCILIIAQIWCVILDNV